MSKGNFLKIVYINFVGCLIFALQGCGDNHLSNNTLTEDMVTVGIKALGELSGTETPLFRSNSDSNSKPLWGVQVCLAPEQGQEYDVSNATKVAHGVFDDLSKITLSLNRNKKYSIEATYMPNGQNEIHYYGPSNDYWELPFNTYGWTKTPINQVIYSPSDYLYGLGGGSNTPAGDANDRRRSLLNEMDRYYGFVSEYTPVEGGSIELDMKRTVFGLTFIGTKVDGFTYDKLLVRLRADASLGELPKEYTLQVDNSQPTSQLVIPLICMIGVRRSALEANYVETFKISIGTAENPALLFYGDISVKRNTMHTYTFNMGTDNVDGGVNATFSDGKMKNEVEKLK